VLLQQQKSKSGKVKQKPSSKDSSQKLFESDKQVNNKAKRVKFDNDNADENAKDTVAEAEKLAAIPFSDEEGIYLCPMSVCAVCL